jgi:hypothetical protein
MQILIPKIMAVASGTVLAFIMTGVAATHAFNGTESTTTLDQRSTVRVGGKDALAGSIVAGQIMTKYHPLPWVGAKLRGVTCPNGLKAQVGASISCLAANASGRRIEIPVRVTAVSGSAVTWSFNR